MILYSHVVAVDTGLAPNPFHDYCTSAVCTPSHMECKANEGNWLIGHSPKKDGHRLVYAMLILKRLTMDVYFNHPDFQCKKPVLDGKPEQQCGDNLYYRNDANQWKRLPSRFHNHPENFIKDVGADLSGHPVFVSDHFYYFGRNRVEIPDFLQGVIQGRHGIKGPNKISSRLAEEFVQWLGDNNKDYYKPRNPQPKDFADHSGDSGPLLTGIYTAWEEDGSGQGKNERDQGCRPSSQPISAKMRGNGERCR
ncbi:MAG TPA: hypothetical protein VMV78_10385 [Thiobacillus sp.]|nr:hypothetical protein [Thiobacillus sp.]